MIDQMNGGYEYSSEPYEVGKRYVGRDGKVYKCIGFEPCGNQGRRKRDPRSTCPTCPGRNRWEGIEKAQCLYWSKYGYLRKYEEPVETMEDRVKRITEQIRKDCNHETEIYR